MAGREPSPADLRCRLRPEDVDALADAYHFLACVYLSGHDPYRGDATHRECDLSHARYMLMLLRERGWSLTRGS